MENEVNKLDEVVVVETTEETTTVKTFVVPKWLNRKNIIIAVVILAILGLGYYYRGMFVAAMVNGQFISRASVVKELEKTAGKTTLDSMINDKLISLEAAKQGINISDEDVAAEFTKLEKQLTDQGQNLDTILATQNVTRADVSKRIVLQKQLEKMLGDKLNVTDAEVDKYIKDNTVTLPAGKEAETKVQIKDGIKANKLNTEAPVLLETLKTNAKINYFVSY